MSLRPRPTLGEFIAAAFVALTALLLVLLSVFYAGSRRTVLLASEELMRQASARVTERIEDHLGEAERTVAGLESEAAAGLLTPATSEAVLVDTLAAHADVTDVTFTWGSAIGVYEQDEGAHEAGDLRLAPKHTGQVSVARSGAALLVRRSVPHDEDWVVETRRIPADDGPPAAEVAVPDPTLHPTFTVPSRPEEHGHALWSDLSYAEADAALPEPDRRRVVSVQKAVATADGAFLGVVRVALLSDRLDALTHVRVDARAERDDHLVFLCDRRGRLISRLDPRDAFALLDAEGAPDPENGDVRVVPAALPPAVDAMLRAPALRTVAAGTTEVARFDVAGISHLASIAAPLGDRTQGWLVGIVVPESHYLGPLEASRRRGLAVAALVIALAAGGAALALRALRRDLGRLIGETTHLRTFDFAPSAGAAGTFRDVDAAAESLEQAKTALRALGKYVPLDLVRELYEARREPVLGAALQDVTLMFSDIAGFTTVAEALAPDALAAALGGYLEALTRAIHATGGIIDKYTGDGVMALWNTPRPVDRPAARACEAALACVTAADALFASPAWQGRPRWRTRFGIHRARVNVGHFGAPDRLSFTAMGDGVNLAARLESLGKHYGTAILVSATIEADARDAFWFRRLDRVAVKGKHEGVEVFELLGRRGDGPRPAFVATYESALDRYFARDFTGALAIVAPLADRDPPSAVLAERCRRFMEQPPPADWDGVWVAAEK